MSCALPIAWRLSAFMLAAITPAALAQTAVTELESEVLVLDDGFQHRRLGRDLDIVLIDSTNPWGYGHLFPRGLPNLRRNLRARLQGLTQLGQRRRAVEQHLDGIGKLVLGSREDNERLHAVRLLQHRL